MKNYTSYFNKIFSKNINFLFIILSFLLLKPEAAVSQTLSSVNLGTSGDYAILSKTGISTSGTTSILGDIGVSPVSATYITGFGLIMDASGTFSTSSLITGKIFGANYADPTPTKMTTAISDMETASTDAAGRTSPDFTELYSGDLTGQTLTSGLYKWGTNVLISAGGVTISGTSNDVWIFQIAQNLDLANGAQVTLIGGAKSSNIFWQVSGQTTIGTTAAMQGIILCGTQVVMKTSATLNGRALAQTAVTLDANSVSTLGLTAVEKNKKISLDFALFQNYPNPFNPSTTIRFNLPEASIVKLTIFNILGQKIRTLLNEFRESGANAINFDASDLNSGIYIYKIEAGKFVQTRKMTLLK